MKAFIGYLAVRAMVLDAMIHRGELSKEKCRDMIHRVQKYVDNSNSSSEALGEFPKALERGEFD